MTLADNVRRLRYDKGLSTDDLASAAGISRTALYQIESGATRSPRASTAKKLAGGLGVSIETLFLGCNWFASSRTRKADRKSAEGQPE